jgi:putative flavoprotein involved in K+ transport
MRLITPSFTANQFGLPDLNAVTPDTSPALSLQDEHPRGPAYAAYLDMVAELEDLDVRTGIEVTDVAPRGDGNGDGDLEIRTTGATNGAAWRARFVVWAAGELQYPRTRGFPGAERCVPTVQVRSWDAHPGDDVVIIGGFESGLDAAVNLVNRGRRVTVLDRDAPWEVVDADPSLTLSPYTLGRLREARDTGALQLVGGVEVEAVTFPERGATVHAADGRSWHADGPPLLAIGFDGSLEVIRDRFKRDEHGRVVLTEQADESTATPGLFLAGPAVTHREAIFCFVYKFRQRFGVVAREIGDRLGTDTEPLEQLRAQQFLLDDLSCCELECAC